MKSKHSSNSLSGRVSEPKNRFHFFWTRSDIFRLVLGGALMAATLSLGACGKEKVPATMGDLAELPYTFDLPVSFKAYNAKHGGLLLEGTPGPADDVVPTVEIEVNLEISSREFSPEKLLKDRWPVVAEYGEFEQAAPRGEMFVSQQGIVLAGDAIKPDGSEVIHVEQWVSKQMHGYTRLVAYASADRFKQLENDIHAIARSLKLKKY